MECSPSSGLRSFPSAPSPDSFLVPNLPASSFSQPTQGNPTAAAYPPSNYLSPLVWPTRAPIFPDAARRFSQLENHASRNPAFDPTMSLLGLIPQTWPENMSLVALVSKIRTPEVAPAGLQQLAGNNQSSDESVFRRGAESEGSPAPTRTTDQLSNLTPVAYREPGGVGVFGRIVEALNPIGSAKANDLPASTAITSSPLRAAVVSGRMTEEEAAVLQQRVNALSPAERLGPVIRAMLPKFDGRTYGILVTNDGRIVEFQSGGSNLPYGNYAIATHVEGKAAAWMRANGATGGVLYHNNPGGTCGYCNSQVKYLLPEGVQLRVVSPEGAVPRNAWSRVTPQTYTGNNAMPKARRFKKDMPAGDSNEN